jgi:hypothetical protein
LKKQEAFLTTQDPGTCRDNVGNFTATVNSTVVPTQHTARSWKHIRRCC